MLKGAKKVALRFKCLNEYIDMYNLVLQSNFYFKNNIQDEKPVSQFLDAYSFAFIPVH